MAGMSPALRAHARAKVNLSLEVVGRRDDGYHDLVSVMQTLSLADTLTIEEAAELTFYCSDSELDTSDNLVVRAARLLRSRCNVSRGCSMYLQKEIPASAGLGGGSSDAAAALAALNTFWNAGATCSDLCAMAEELGSDVPFFLYGGTSLVRGRGEKVTRLRDPRPAWYVLANPGVPARTADVFSALSPDEWTSGEATLAMAMSISGDGRSTLLGVNGLEPSLFRINREAKECFDLVSSLASGRAIVAGSGPTVVAGSDTEESAMEIARLLTGRVPWVRVARSHSPAPGELPCA
jgi:4-diphosphocytidyl-2-C-methyl-D-erythritol kinase